MCLQCTYLRKYCVIGYKVTTWGLGSGNYLVIGNTIISSLVCACHGEQDCKQLLCLMGYYSIYYKWSIRAHIIIILRFVCPNNFPSFLQRYLFSGGATCQSHEILAIANLTILSVSNGQNQSFFSCWRNPMLLMGIKDYCNFCFNADFMQYGFHLSFIYCIFYYFLTPCLLRPSSQWWHSVRAVSFTTVIFSHCFRSSGVVFFSMASGSDGLDRLNTPKCTNRLSKEKSSYLLQHAHNPVDWWVALRS